jgi:hypothetical protein
MYIESVQKQAPLLTFVAQAKTNTVGEENASSGNDMRCADVIHLLQPSVTNNEPWCSVCLFFASIVNHVLMPDI